MDGRQGWRWSWLSDDAAPNGWSWVSDDETAILQPTQHPGDHGIAQFVMKPFDPQARDELGNKQHCKRGHSTSPWDAEWSSLWQAFMHFSRLWDRLVAKGEYSNY